MAYTRDSILYDLEHLNGRFFPDLEHGYFHTAGSRLTLFADSERWAIVFEKSGYGNRSFTGQIELNYFGNCLKNLETYGLYNQIVSNAKWVDLISSDELERIQVDFEMVSEKAETVKVRNTHIPIEHDLSKYAERGIEPETGEDSQVRLDFVSLIRYLDETHLDIFRATDDELRLCIPNDLPLLMKIDSWHHKSYSDWTAEMKDEKVLGTPPSAYETFKMIADILVSKDTTRWKPTLPANNNWRNWPNAGFL